MIILGENFINPTTSEALIMKERYCCENVIITFKVIGGKDEEKRYKRVIRHTDYKKEELDKERILRTITGNIIRYPQIPKPNETMRY